MNKKKQKKKKRKRKKNPKTKSFCLFCALVHPNETTELAESRENFILLAVKV